MDVELYKRNFFYGMDAKNDVIDYIILREADKMLEIDMNTINTSLYKVEYTIEKIKELVIQLYRFVQLNEPTKKQTYFYNEINAESTEIEQLVEKRIENLYNRYIITKGEKNYERSAIYITGGDEYHKYPGKEYYKKMQDNIWLQNIVQILEELKTLEIENKEQYYALFLDTKYNRSKNAIEQLKQEQEYLKSKKSNEKKTTDRIEEIETILQVLPQQIENILRIFSKYMASIKISKQDISQQLIEKLPGEYIKQNFSDYKTISSLKKEATNDKYRARVNKKIQEIENKIQDMENVKE